MKIILVGYPGSKKIIPISSYLLSKYTQNYFDIHFLNYGGYDNDIFGCEYIELSKYQKKVGDWGKDILKYLKKLNDKFIIFSLDDYLISTWVDIKFFDQFFHSTIKNIDFLNIKLGLTPALTRQNDCLQSDVSKNLLKLKKNVNYQFTTQYAIWNRSKLIKIMENYMNPFLFWKKNLSPWDFELKLSKKSNLNNENLFCLKSPNFIYYEGSGLSSRNPDKICVNGLRIEDLNYLISKNYLIENDLILSHNSKKYLNFDFTFDQQFYLKNHPYDQVGEVGIFKEITKLLYEQRDKKLPLN